MRPRPEGDLTKRLREILSRDFDGNANLMAVAMRSDQGSLSRYLNGKRVPGFTKLQALAQTLGLPLESLLGESAAPSGYPTGRAALPVFTELLVTSPIDADRSLCFGERFVAPSLVRTSRYYHQLKESVSAHMLPRDFLLIETDPNAFRLGWTMLDWVVISHEAKPFLATVEVDPEADCPSHYYTYTQELRPGVRATIGNYRYGNLAQHGLLFQSEPEIHKLTREHDIVGQVLRLERDTV